LDSAFETYGNRRLDMLLNCERSRPAGTCDVTMSRRYMAAAATLFSLICPWDEAACFSKARHDAK
jgi:hypothetical protein